MTGVNSDRNLLVGVLAVQMDFVRREQLLEAMSAWMLEKRTPLEDILHRQGALDDDTRKLLVALVAKHLALHGHDAQRSLQAVTALGPLQQDLKSLADPQIYASLQRLPAAAADPFVTQAVSTGAVTSAGHRFKILRPHAKGGLGQVSVALDTELHREVALKEIQAPHADYPQSRARFVLEAEITGGLEHPGIVPIYGLGTYSDGRPYYAMRFIRGDSLKEALERFHETDFSNQPSQRLLELRKLLGRFIDVCNAMEYAHSRGVLHRDLKPGNVMLGKYGETLVVDWGLAKTVPRDSSHMSKADITRQFFDEPPIIPTSGSGTAPTQMGSALGTPAYMSPEQAAGRLNELGPSSDVYSLGATLYHVLTGQPPVSSETWDVGEQLRRVQRGDFPPPRSIKRDTPKALEAICQKAMALRPQDRYASAVELANDLEHWLADEPIVAAPDRFTDRALRWLRHNWPGAFSAAAALLVIAIVSIVFAVILDGQKRAVTTAKNAAEQLAHEKSLLAESERVAKDDARRAIDNYVKVVLEQLKDERFQPLRKTLLADARAYYEELIDRVGRDDADQNELADALVIVGNINRSTGSAAEASKSYLAALDTRRKLVAAESNNLEYQRNLAGVYNILGIHYQDRGEWQQALKFYNDALAIQRELVKHGGPAGQDHVHLANTLNNRGALQKEQGALVESLQSFQEALAVYQSLVRLNPRNSAYVSYLANCHNNIGELQKVREELDEALNSYQEALTLQKKLTEDHPNLSILKANLAKTYGNLGGLQQKRGDPDGALAAYQEALKIQQRLAEASPLVRDLQNTLAKFHNNIGVLQQERGDRQPALNSYREALAIRQKLAPESALDASFQEDLARNHLNIAELAETAGTEAARKSLADCDGILTGLQERFPSESRYAELRTRWTKMNRSLTSDNKSEK
jgi:serine/threonine-protein kinase